MRRWLPLALMVCAALCLTTSAVAAEGDSAEGGAALVDDAQAAFDAANSQYYQGEYEAAARGYADVLASHQVEDAVLYHNLGNAYFRTGAYGSAILYYRRGLLLDPPDSVGAGLSKNLEIARRVLQDRYRSGGDKTQFIYGEPGGLFYRLTHLAAVSTLAALFIATWWLLFGLLIAWRARGAAGRPFGGAAIPVAVLLLLVGVLLWGRVSTDQHYRLGIVVQEEVVLREGPHPDARGVDLPEGMELRIVDATDGWTRVELANGRDGWVALGSVKQI